MYNRTFVPSRKLFEGNSPGTADWLEAFKRSKNAIVIGEEASRKALQRSVKHSTVTCKSSSTANFT